MKLGQQANGDFRKPDPICKMSGTLGLYNQSLSKQQLLKHNFHPQDDEFKIEWSKGIIVDEDMELTTSQREMKLVMAVVGPPKCAIFMGQPAWAQNGEF